MHRQHCRQTKLSRRRQVMSAAAPGPAVLMVQRAWMPAEQGLEHLESGVRPIAAHLSGLQRCVHRVSFDGKAGEFGDWRAGLFARGDEGADYTVLGQPSREGSDIDLGPPQSVDRETKHLQDVSAIPH